MRQFAAENFVTDLVCDHYTIGYRSIRCMVLNLHPGMAGGSLPLKIS